MEENIRDILYQDERVLKALKVYRKTKPTDLARVGPWAFESPAEHVIYLRLPQPLKQGSRYTLAFSGGPFEEQTFAHQPTEQRSDAVHVSHLGFRPSDPAKVAFLSCWMGEFDLCCSSLYTLFGGHAS